ncbi:hypothetical protein M0805_004351 [Coniferiporia weirii]|nr:hypothetical protein M0805_004351 [Coniferiporia weirii]
MRHRALHKRQVSTVPSVPTANGFGGALTLATPTDGVVSTALLASGSPTGLDSNVLTTSVPVVSPTVGSATSSGSAAGSSATTASASSSSISLGAVIGICVGVFVALSAVLLLIYCMGSRRRSEKRAAAKRHGDEAERRKSGRELWVKMEDKDNDEKYEKYAMKHTTQVSIPAAAGVPTTVERSITVKSAKSTKTFKSVGYGAGLGLSETFKTPELPPQLEFTDSDIGTGRGFEQPVVPPYARTQGAPISWDGETVAEGSSYLSLKRESGSVNFGHVNSPMSSSMVVSYQTPPAVETSLHQWEEAEVVSPDGAEDAYGGVEDAQHQDASRMSQETIKGPITQRGASRNPFLDQNPFDDVAATVLSQPAPPSAGSGSSASFFSAETDLTMRSDAFAAAEATVAQHERADSNEHALASLIAALNISPQEARERLSAAVMPTPRTSGMSFIAPSFNTIESSTSEADTVVLDGESYRRFPLPPTDIELHNGGL